MPEFEKFRHTEGGAVLDNGMNDGFDDGFSDGFDDDFGDASDGGFDNAFGDASDGELQPSVSTVEGAYSASPTTRRPGSEKVDLKEAFATLFRAISDRFTGKGKPARSTAVDGSDASFASEFDRAVDDGFSAPQEEPDPVPDQAENTFPLEDNPPEEPSYDTAPGELPHSAPDRREQFFGDRYYPQTPAYTEPVYVPDFGISDNDYDLIGPSEYTMNDDLPEHKEDTPSAPADLRPSGSATGVFAAISHALKKFGKRLPSFRPKVYVVPEPEYHPEQDGIGTPTLASDIRRILEEQNKPGETEQEYDKMRQYISTVSTDTRIRPGDIKPPANIGEVRAAQDELYDLINQISNTNEQQRSRIGVYEKPPEEDPYNYRGINDNRQLDTDMEAYSFDMNTRYGFESEKKVDPGREWTEREYNRVYNQAVSQQPDDRGMETGGFSDGFDDDFDDDFGGASGNVPTGNAGGFGDGFDDGFDDDFSGASGNVPTGNAGGFGDGFDDSFDDDFSENGDGRGQPLPQRRNSRVREKNYENPDSNASYSEGFSRYREKRSAERNAFHRRQNH